MTSQAEQLQNLMGFFDIGQAAQQHEEYERRSPNRKLMGSHSTKQHTPPLVQKRVAAAEMVFDEAKFERF
jgi:hypothetical protein